MEIIRSGRNDADLGIARTVYVAGGVRACCTMQITYYFFEEKDLISACD